MNRFFYGRHKKVHTNFLFFNYRYNCFSLQITEHQHDFGSFTENGPIYGLSPEILSLLISMLLFCIIMISCWHLDTRCYTLFYYCFPARTSSIATIDSLDDYARYSDDGARDTDEKVAGLWIRI